METEEPPVKKVKLDNGSELLGAQSEDPVPTNDTPKILETSHQEVTEESHDPFSQHPEQQTGDDVATPALSKSALKKQQRFEKWEAGREDRKVKRKEKLKAKKERRREAFAQARENSDIPEPPPRERSERKALLGTQVPITVIFDCGFEDLMYDNELKSLGVQITRSYSDNRKAKYQSHLAISSFGGKMKERFDGILAKQYTSWKGVRFFPEDFVDVAEKARQWMAGAGGGVIEGALEQHDDSNGEDAQGEIVYLSSDSDATLDRLKPNSTYIIGGLVDKNREKGLCHKRACSRGIKTAKLPIGEFMKMNSRQVLTTNQVMEIMLNWLESGDWGKAFMEVIPKRKGGQLLEDDKAGSADEEMASPLNETSSTPSGEKVIQKPIREPRNPIPAEDLKAAPTLKHKGSRNFVRQASDSPLGKRKANETD